MTQIEVRVEKELEKAMEKVDGGILKSLIDKWQGYLESLNHKDRYDDADHTALYIYKEVVKDLQKLG